MARAYHDLHPRMLREVVHRSDYFMTLSLSPRDGCPPHYCWAWVDWPLHSALARYKVGSTMKSTEDRLMWSSRQYCQVSDCATGIEPHRLQLARVPARKAREHLIPIYTGSQSLAVLCIQGSTAETVADSFVKAEIDSGHERVPFWICKIAANT